MNRCFASPDWRDAIPQPICEEHPEYTALYHKAWELAFAHIKDVPGMPQTPYMDEAFVDTHIWIWDTCFMSLFCKYAQDTFPGVESLTNFYEVLYGGKHLAQVIPTEREPAWTGRVVGEPFEMKIHIADNPPLFAWVEYENALLRGDKEYVRRLLYDRRVLQRHYDWLEQLDQPVTPRGVFVPTCWRSHPCGYHWEGGRSGMDNTPRGRSGLHAEGQRPNPPDMLWIDALCQQALSASMIARLFALVGDAEQQAQWNRKFEEKKALLNRYYWDDEDGFYYDIHDETHRFYKVPSIASYWTLTAGVATDERAAALVGKLENEHAFGGAVPFTTVARGDSDFHDDGEYWRGGVWLPTAYATLIGLKNYGFYAVAQRTALRLLEHISQTYAHFEPHTIWEAYSPTAYRPAANETGTGALVRPDFCGWSALGPISVYLEFVLGFHTIDAFRNVVEWARPTAFRGKIGIKNLRFGTVVTDVEAEGDRCTVTANEPYTLVVNGTPYAIRPGTQTWTL